MNWLKIETTLEFRRTLRSRFTQVEGERVIRGDQEARRADGRDPLPLVVTPRLRALCFQLAVTGTTEKEP
jgi:hypothetical protein